MMLQRFRPLGVDRINNAVRDLVLPEAVYKTCPWQPRDLVETGLRQWLRCCGAAMRDGQVIGMPSFAVDEAWHGLILCTMRYQRFCDSAYGRFLHHFPAGEGSGNPDDPMSDQLGRTVVAWNMVAQPDEKCVLWDLDTVVGVDDPWGVPGERVDLIEAALRAEA
ncbi:hypothetical protein ACFVUS_37460 [Nocardia sp. NPDC058058]|uniref:hypothetical protein n=1 Tax=Nocardia sp. NPDC058058 TaxID=3346317 RepID=UPI0036DC7BDF